MAVAIPVETLVAIPEAVILVAVEIITSRLETKGLGLRPQPTLPM
jgi:hypothetical protein